VGFVGKSLIVVVVFKQGRCRTAAAQTCDHEQEMKKEHAV
jgi:hypothetical protein